MTEKPSTYMLENMWEMLVICSLEWRKGISLKALQYILSSYYSCTAWSAKDACAKLKYIVNVIL